jgi:glycerol-3-phosphate O-acyltransferase
VASEAMEKDVTPAMSSAEPATPGADHLPADASAADLHRRHVDAEQHEHEREHAAATRVERVRDSDQPELPL